jgi:hypothetical protein
VDAVTGILAFYSACCFYPQSTTVDAAGNLYIVDGGGRGRVQKIAPGTITSVTTVAGNPNAKTSGDGGLATDTNIPGITAVAAAPNGDLYIGQYGPPSGIRKVSAATGIITTAKWNSPDPRYDPVSIAIAPRVSSSSPPGQGFSGSIP